MKMETHIAPLTADAKKIDRKRMTWRAVWQRWMLKVHWISSALALLGLFFFATTGLTLLHEAQLADGVSKVIQHEGLLPESILDDLKHMPADAELLPSSFRLWVKSQWHLNLHPKAIESQDNEIFVDLKRPGVDAWISIDCVKRLVRYESTDHGWVAYFNDLHRGKNVGPVWIWLATAFALCCMVFALTGLALLQLRARQRWTVWPVVGVGVVVPMILVLLFVH